MDEENDPRNDFNLLESYVAELGFELVTPGSVVKHAAYSAMAPGQMEANIASFFKIFYFSWLLSLGEITGNY